MPFILCFPFPNSFLSFPTFPHKSLHPSFLFLIIIQKASKVNIIQKETQKQSKIDKHKNSHGQQKSTRNKHRYIVTYIHRYRKFIKRKLETKIFKQKIWKFRKKHRKSILRLNETSKISLSLFLFNIYCWDQGLPLIVVCLPSLGQK